MPNIDKIRDVPTHTIKNYLKVSLYIDVMYVNGIMFLVGASNTLASFNMYTKEKSNRRSSLKLFLP